MVIAPKFWMYIVLFFLGQFEPYDWGFYAHRLINRTAVFTVPQPLFSFYRKHISYIEHHAVDPDKRRYASNVEAVRHYLDLDHWNQYDSKRLLQQLPDVLLSFGHLSIVDSAEDKLIEDYNGLISTGGREYQDFTVDHYLSIREEVGRRLFDLLSEGTLEFTINDRYRVILRDQFSDHGILPYHLTWYQEQLRKAFEKTDIDQILRISAELGHYISDAHVPLHTTTNYNGQLTGQEGIHGFWESRLPELFANREYDLFVGTGVYISDKDKFFWDIIMDSHAQVAVVLDEDKKLSESFPGDQQYCFEDRNGQQIRVRCQEYSKAYQEAMNGMVEVQMTKSIKAIGSCWYTAWVDAGKPVINDFGDNFLEDVNPSIVTDTLTDNEHILRPIKMKE